jgi:hypothetical protein
VEELAEEIRRQDAKRIEDHPKGRRTKERKLERLVGWGEPVDDTDSNNFCFDVVNRLGVGNRVGIVSTAWAIGNTEPDVGYGPDALDVSWG